MHTPNFFPAPVTSGVECSDLHEAVSPQTTFSRFPDLGHAPVMVLSPLLPHNQPVASGVLTVISFTQMFPVASRLSPRPPPPPTQSLSSIIHSPHWSQEGLLWNSDLLSWPLLLESSMPALTFRHHFSPFVGRMSDAQMPAASSCALPHTRIGLLARRKCAFSHHCTLHTIISWFQVPSPPFLPASPAWPLGLNSHIPFAKSLRFLPRAE